MCLCIFQRNKGARGSPILGPGRENSKPFLPPSQNMQNMSGGDDSALSSHFSGMSLGGSQGPSPMGSKYQTPVKVRNQLTTNRLPFTEFDVNSTLSGNKNYVLHIQQQRFEMTFSGLCWTKNSTGHKIALILMLSSCRNTFKTEVVAFLTGSQSRSKRICSKVWRQQFQRFSKFNAQCEHSIFSVICSHGRSWSRRHTTKPNCCW